MQQPRRAVQDESAIAVCAVYAGVAAVSTLRSRSTGRGTTGGIKVPSEALGRDYDLVCSPNWFFKPGVPNTKPSRLCW